jgi:hypothetical protein
MERTVPRIASEEIDLFLRTSYSLLRSSSEVQIRTLEEAHAGMNSLLHPDVREVHPDMSAFIYCLLRLPPEINQANLVVLGQSLDVFRKKGVGNINAWKQVSAPARRRRCFFNGQDTLACLIASRSDIDDIIPLLTAYQIEWNKLHRLLQDVPENISFPEVSDDETSFSELAKALLISNDDLLRLITIWGEDTSTNIKLIASKKCKFQVQLLSSSLSAYRRATHAWWENIISANNALTERPIYFVSSNVHSLINIVTGYALRYQDELIHFIENSGDESLQKEWFDIQAREVPSSRENYFYYVLKKYLNTPGGQRLREERLAQEQRCGIIRISSENSFEMDAQVIEIEKINKDMMDPRLQQGNQSFLEHSDAFILNIDYPLGLAAYDILRKVSDHAGEVLGVYILGKAATLNAIVGDVMIPNVVYDGQSYNTYLFSNCFEAQDVAPNLVYGTVLDNQKAVSVRGTFLQNAEYMDVYYREGYADIEMEAGPFLSAVYEMYRPKRHPIDEIVSLYNLPFDLGMLHYASDRPLSKGRNLGAGSLSYFGMDPTYATSLTTLKRIFKVECERIERCG